LVVFDLDGTLVDSSGDLATAVNRMLDSLFLDTRRLTQDQVRSFIGNGARKLVERSLRAAGVDGRVEEALPVFLDRYQECLLDTTRPYNGVEEALKALSPRSLAVLTNKPGDMSRRILRGLGLGERFVRVYGTGDLPERKPHPVGLLRLLEETSIPACEAVMVGDSAVDVQTGRRAGVRTVGVRYGFDPDGLASESPDETIDDLRQLVGLL
jgi:phosphoglycolate phosphatase